MEKYAVLIADADEDLSAVFELMLEDDFSLTMVNDGQKAISALQTAPFHLVILDIPLPVKSGFEVLEFVRTMSPSDRPGVIALSEDMSDNSIKKAYSLGAGDYIGKPFNVVAFHQRLMRLARDVNKIKSLQQDDDSKRSLAETAMKQASAYGSGLELLARLNQCHTIEDFMDRLTAGLQSQGYHCAVEFRFKDTRYHFDVDTRTCSDNEIKVFQLLHDKGRIYHFGKRTIFNEENSSILVKNMPTEGTMSYDAAIDLFAKLVPAVGSRFIALKHLKTMDETRGSLNSSMNLVSEALSEMEQQRRQKLDEVASAIGLSFHELDLTEKQENFFLQLMEKKLKPDEKNDKFSEIVALLNSCAERLSVDVPVDTPTDVSDDDIELF